MEQKLNWRTGSAIGGERTSIQLTLSIRRQSSAAAGLQDGGVGARQTREQQNGDDVAENQNRAKLIEDALLFHHPHSDSVDQ